MMVSVRGQTDFVLTSGIWRAVTAEATYVIDLDAGTATRMPATDALVVTTSEFATVAVSTPAAVEFGVPLPAEWGYPDQTPVRELQRVIV